MRRRFALIGLLGAIVVSGGCPDPPPRTFGPSTQQHWDFDMGRQGSGGIRFSAVGREGGPQTGDCLNAVCHTRIENLAVLTLTATASPGFRFRFWIDDPERHLPCANSERSTETLQIIVFRDGGCFAVFEPIDGGTPTTPGLR